MVEMAAPTWARARVRARARAAPHPACVHAHVQVGVGAPFYRMARFLGISRKRSALQIPKKRGTYIVYVCNIL